MHVHPFCRDSLEFAFSFCRHGGSLSLSVYTNFIALFTSLNDMPIVHLEFSRRLSRRPAVVCIIESLERDCMFMICIRLNLLQTS
jgi:hypothetical protein